MKKIKLPLIAILLWFIVIVGFTQTNSSYPPPSANSISDDYQFDMHDDVQERLYLLSMDTNISPCDDFYGYACGNWKPENGGGTYQETLTKLDYEVNVELKQILRNVSQTTSKKYAAEVSDYYKSCLATEVPTTVEYLKWLETHEHDLQWPISVTQGNSIYQTPQQYDWIRMLAILRKYGFNDVIVHEAAVPKDTNPNILVLELGRPQDLGKHTMNNLRYDVVTGTLRFLMPEREYRTLWSDSQDLDNKLLELKTKYETDDEMRFTTVSGLNDQPWLLQYLSVLLDIHNLDPTMELVITNISYLRAVVDFLQTYNPRFVCEYLQLKFLSYLNYKQFKTEYRDCVSSTRLLFPLPTQWLFEQNHPELETEIDVVNKMFTKIKQIFLKVLNKNVYNLDSSMMKFFRAKLRTLQLRIVYLASHSLDELYRNLNLSPNDYYGNRLKIYNFNFQATHRHLNMRLRRNALEFLPLEQYDTASSLLPYILARQRSVLVPLGILQHPYYRPELPMAYIYSSIGYLLARQIVYEFTIADIDVGAYGQVFSYVLDMLIQNEDFRMDFEHIAQHHRGETEEVDSAINGLKLAYQTFKEDQYDENLLKSFFLNFAQIYCGTADASYHRPSQSTLNRKIVNFSVNHIGDFSRAFGCERGAVHGLLFWNKNDD
ncbi:endothelin-converting enzyme 1-like [Musca vetustissima]|uniref:endothelin-converting enzyme 1-like n=1 Tax=Musca vetustissima TaxID=27455 RepID=UPI002AB61D70|nr:endothelin-converting enzyme 1-like [Musca vetustissima]